MNDDLTGRINGWTCDTCGCTTYAIHVDHGVTPMFLACRAEGVRPDKAKCKGRASSLMYPSTPPPQHVKDAVKWEWYMPTLKQARRMGMNVYEHVTLGGLMIRLLTDAGRKLLNDE